MAGESATTGFVMHGARDAIAYGLTHIEEQVKAIERAVEENPGLAFDLSKTLVESACKSILTSRNVAFDGNDDLPKLFKSVSNCVPFLPPALAAEAAARESLLKTLNGLSTSLQGVCELRNEFGFAAHGQDRSRQGMEAVQALLAAQAADAIVGFLFRVHSDAIGRPRIPRIEYGDHPAFNEWIDNGNSPIQIFDLPPYLPSEVLFNVDQQAYRELLTNFESGQNSEESV